MGGKTTATLEKPQPRINAVLWLNGAAWESNPPTAGLRRRTGFEDCTDYALSSTFATRPSVRPSVRRL